MEKLFNARRIKAKASESSEVSRNKASNMLLQGYQQRVEWLSDSRCKVPSETEDGKSYIVDIVYAYCPCPAAVAKGTFHFYAE